MPDRIVREVRLSARPDRVWIALTEAEEFAAWFRARFDGPFVLGALTRGVVIDPAGTEHPFWLRTEEMDPPHRFAFRWPMEAGVAPDDPDIARKSTLVAFTLLPDGAGTHLTITESGFDALPPDVAEAKLRDNAGGWEIQGGRIAAYLEA